MVLSKINIYFFIGFDGYTLPPIWQMSKTFYFFFSEGIPYLINQVVSRSLIKLFYQSFIKTENICILVSMRKNIVYDYFDNLQINLVLTSKFLSWHLRCSFWWKMTQIFVLQFVSCQTSYWPFFYRWYLVLADVSTSAPGISFGFARVAKYSCRNRRLIKLPYFPTVAYQKYQCWKYRQGKYSLFTAYFWSI